MMKKGRHDGGFRLIPKMSREEWRMEICLWLGGALGLVLGIIYLKRNPQELSVRRPGRAAATVTGGIRCAAWAEGTACIWR